jgi:hypothetical protein
MQDKRSSSGILVSKSFRKWAFGRREKVVIG